MSFFREWLSLPVLCMFSLMAGYVQCQIPQTTNESIPQEQSVTAEQIKGWLLGCSGVLWERNHDKFDTLAGEPRTRRNLIKRHEFFSEWWKIKNTEDLYDDLDWLANGGHRDDFVRDLIRVKHMDPNEFWTFINQGREVKPEKLNDYLTAWWYRDEVGDANLIGWDYCRYICLCRWGYQCGFIDEKTAWKHIIQAGMKLQLTFDSWEQMGQNYLIGRRYWSYKRTKENGDMYEDAFQQLCQMPSSPWNQYPWDLDLSNAYEIIMQDIEKNPDPGPVKEPYRTIDVSMKPPLEFPKLKPVVNRLTDLQKEGPVRIVPDEYVTIQSAIDAADEGDIVFIREGVYVETVKVKEKSDICIIGESRDRVMIQNSEPNAMSVIRVHASHNILLSDMTVESREGSNRENHYVVCVSESTADIKRCAVRNSLETAICYFLSAKGTIQDSIIESNATFGLYVIDTGTEVLLANCCVKDNGQVGVYVKQEGTVNVTESLICNNESIGILVSGQGSRVECSKSQFQKNQSHGLTVNKGAQATIQDCHISHNQKCGVLVSGENTVALQENVQSYENKSYGIHVTQKAQAKIVNCMAVENGEGGILAYEGAHNVLIRDTESVNNNGYGIWFCKQAKGSVKSCRTDNNSKTGINITQSSVCHVENNECFNNKTYGIVVIDSKVNLISNTISNNYQSGIYIGGQPTRGVFEKNFCIGNNWFGIQISDGAKVTVSENICEDNTQEGILVSGDDSPVANIIGNRCLNNYPSGILFKNGAKGSIRDNICQQNPWAGIAVRGENTNPVIEGNDCSQNGTWGIAVWSDASPGWGAANTTQENGKDGIMIR